MARRCAEVGAPGQTASTWFVAEDVRVGLDGWLGEGEIGEIAEPLR